MELSKRAQQLEPSVTLSAAAKAKELKASGLDILSLTLGEPDYKTPENIRRRAVEAINEGGASFYTPASGIPALKQAIIARTEADYGLTYELDQVAVTTGAKFALYAIFQALLDKGDEVIIPTPYWVSYAEQVKLAEGTPVFVQGQQDNDFKVTLSQIKHVYTEQTKAIIINSPSNPTGMIYTARELRDIGEWAVEKGILIIADDIYGKLVYNGNKFTPIATISEAIRRQTIIVSGVSKTYSMTGWRIGYVLGDPVLVAAIADISSQSVSNPTTVSQYAALEALSGDQESVETMRQTFEERLNRMYPLVAGLPGVKLQKPQGAFYLFPNVSETMELCGYDNIDLFVEDLLIEAHVAVVTGSGFGAPENFRISYATDMATLVEAVNRMAAFIQKKMNERWSKK